MIKFPKDGRESEIMALFNSDLEALIYIVLIGIALFLCNKVISSLLKHIKKVSVKTENKVSFILNLVSFIIVIYLIIEGFPSFEKIDPTYAAILTGAISTALAFASSGIFKNLISGIVLMFIGPFDEGDIVKIKGDKGIVRQITLSKVILETFDGKFIEISNNEIISSTIINYTKKIGRIRTFEQFFKKIQSPQVKGMAQLNELDDTYLRDLYQQCKKNRKTVIHKYTFRMFFPYEGIRKKLEQVQEVCFKYKSVFGARPWFDIINFGTKINVKFNIITLDSMTILNDQPLFAHDLYRIILQSVVK